MLNKSLTCEANIFLHVASLIGTFTLCFIDRYFHRVKENLILNFVPLSKYYTVNTPELCIKQYYQVCVGFRLRQNLKIYIFKLFKLLAGNTEFEEMILDNFREISVKYEIFKQRWRDGRLGKTAKFWIIYLIFMKW